MTDHLENRLGTAGVDPAIARSNPRSSLDLSHRERPYRAMRRQRDEFESDSKLARLHAPLGAARSIFCRWSLIVATIFMLGAEPAWASKAGAEHGLNSAELVCVDCLPINPSDRAPAMLRTKTRPGGERRSAPRALRRRPETSADSTSVVPTVLIGHSVLFREGLKLILGATQFKVVASAVSLDELRSQSSVGSEAGIYVLDARDDSAAAAAEIRTAKTLYPSARCVVLHDRYDPLAVSAAMDAGAAAYLLKSNGKDALVKALEMVMLGSTVLPAAARQPTAAASPAEEHRPMPRAMEAQDVQRSQGNGLAHHLSTREIETLYGLQAGSSNKHIARKFSIAEATVKVHVKAILRKIRVENRTQAAIWAIEHLPPRPAIERLPMGLGAGGAPSAEPRDFRQSAAS